MKARQGAARSCAFDGRSRLGIPLQRSQRAFDALNDQIRRERIFAVDYFACGEKRAARAGRPLNRFFFHEPRSAVR